MKKTALTLTILSVLCVLAYAGPEQYSGKEMKQVAPAPPPCPNWTGFYIGGFGGFKYGVVDPTMSLGGDWFPTYADDAHAIESRADDNLDTSGAELGGLIGYNYQWGQWVFGLEASGGYLWLRNSNVTGHFTIPEFEDTYHVSTSFKSHYLVTLGPRIGYAFCKWLPYVTGGLAIGDIDFNQEVVEFDEEFRQGGSKTETNTGWFVGGGLQDAITNHWSARVQYQYIDLGDISFTHSTTESNYPGSSRVSQKEHNASVAIIYGF